MRTIALALILALGIALPASAYDPAKQPPVTDPGSAYELGRLQVHQGNWERAAALFRRAVAEDPQNFRAYTLLGYSLRHAGRLKEALAAYDRAVAINPRHPEALEYRGLAYLMAGNREAALADHARLVALGSPIAEDLKQAIDSEALAGK